MGRSIIKRLGSLQGNMGIPYDMALTQNNMGFTYENMSFPSDFMGFSLDIVKLINCNYIFK